MPHGGMSSASAAVGPLSIGAVRAARGGCRARSDEQAGGLHRRAVRPTRAGRAAGGRPARSRGGYAGARGGPR